MEAECTGRNDTVVRSIARRVIGFAGIAVLVVVALAASDGLLAGAPFIALALAGAIAIAATGAWVARATADEFRAQAIELERLAGQLSSAAERIDAQRRRALNAMADTIERESGIVMAKLAQQAKSKAAGSDVDGLLHLAREGVARAVRAACGDVERRRWPRVWLPGMVEIQVASRRVTAPIIDVSAGGMRIGGTLAAGIGEHCRVQLPGVGPELPAKILALSASEARLRFDIDEITRAVINRMLESIDRERATAA